MKKLVLLSLGILFSISICTTQDTSKHLQDFAQDLASANVKLRGELMLFGKYKNNLSSLNYESYLNLLEKAETESNKGITKIIKKSDKHYFVSKEKTFHIVLYNKKFNAVIYDNAYTPFIDSIKILNANERISDLSQFLR